MAFSKWAVFDSTYPDFDQKLGVEIDRLVFDPHDGQLKIMEDPCVS